MLLTIDSFAGIELLRDSPLAHSVRARMGEADYCLTHGICLAEVAAFGLRHGTEKDRVLADLFEVTEAAEVIDTDPELALAAATATLELKKHAKALGLPSPGTADGLVLATARRFKSQVLTGDAHFKGLPETSWLE